MPKMGIIDGILVPLPYFFLKGNTEAHVKIYRKEE